MTSKKKTFQSGTRPLAWSINPEPSFPLTLATTQPETITTTVLILFSNLYDSAHTLPLPLPPPPQECASGGHSFHIFSEW